MPVYFSVLLCLIPSIRESRSGAKVNSLAALKARRFSVLQTGTEMAKSQGPENIGRENAVPPPSASQAVTSPTAITFENNGNLPPPVGPEKQFRGAGGGAKRIRTAGTVPQPEEPFGNGGVRGR